MMDNASFGLGATILSLAMAAGAVAFGALILRAILTGLKAAVSKSQDNID